MPTVELGGRRIGYREWGEGPPVLFAHCSLAFSGLWRGVAERLADRWRCISVDLPGHGASDRGDETVSLQFEGVAFIRELAAHLETGPAHLVGLSLGGAVMGRVAVAEPDLARSLTFIEPVYFHLIDHRTDLAKENWESMAPVREAAEAGRYADAASAFMDRWGQPGQFERMPAAAQEAVSRSMKWLAEDFDMVSFWPEAQITREALAAIHAPVLLMHGAETQGSAKAVLDELAALQPGAARAEIDGAGHLSPVDAPEKVAARLAAFFGAVEAG